MTRPETCGVAGGAFSLWMNIIDCLNGSIGGLITTIPKTSFFRIQCSV